MTDIIERLKEPEAHYPGNFDTPKRANAMLSCLCQEAAEEIEALRREVDRLKSENNKLGLNFISISGQAFDAWAESASSQAREQRLRYALDHYQHGGSNYAKIAKDALSISQDTTALSATIAKAGEVMRERAILPFIQDNCEYFGREITDAIRSIPAITMDDIK